MAAACCCESSSKSSITIYGPREIEDDFGWYDLEDDFSRVADKIDKMCRTTKLNDEMIMAEQEYLQSGYCCCLGLLDPATNFMINGSIFDYAESSVEEDHEEEDHEEGMAERSLDGLIAFLACLFPYLHDGEALWYLDAVDADPMAAAALIVTRRGVKSFSLSNAAAAMEMALRCAAVAAKYPDPSLLVKGWTNVSPCLMDLDCRLSGMYRMLRVPFPHVDITGAWTLANARLERRQRGRCRLTAEQLPPVGGAMKRMLLARIHGFYLQALRSFPKDELTKKYHRALAMGGYCYGPLHPAANIIVNTVRYEQTIPSTSASLFESAMISTKFLSRLAARSLYGLVSFLCARYPSLTPDHAMQRLLVADVSLQAADPDLLTEPNNLSQTHSYYIYKNRLDWSGCPRIGSSGQDTDEVRFQERAVRKAAVSVSEAYAAAATAAFHPSPPAQGEFLGSPASVKFLQTAEDVLRLDDGHQLSDTELYALCRLVSPPGYYDSVVGMSHSNPHQEPAPTEECGACATGKGKFWILHDDVKRMVLAALNKFNRDNKTQYSLHVICGVNEQVSGPESCSSEDINVNPCFPCKYLHRHINFLATCLDEDLHNQPRNNLYVADQPTKLFFAECSPAGDDSWCAPVDSSPDAAAGQARCFYCESAGSKIIHPAWAGFHGSDFQEAFFGSDDLYSNDSLIADSMDWVYGVEEDGIYENNCKHKLW